MMYLSYALLWFVEPKYFLVAISFHLTKSNPNTFVTLLQLKFMFVMFVYVEVKLIFVTCMNFNLSSAEF